jgi:hypothetical protein
LAKEFKYICGMGGQEINKMTGHQYWHQPMDQHLDWHIRAYIWCKFEAYLCRNNWQKNLNMSMLWADRQKFKK